MLRFSAGPPYEDLAFRIVNKEWEYNHKKVCVAVGMWSVLLGGICVCV